MTFLKKLNLTEKDLKKAEEEFKAAIIKAWEAGVKEQYEFQQGKFDSFGSLGDFPHKADVSLSGENYYKNTYENGTNKR
jgi:hypothetical protein